MPYDAVSRALAYVSCLTTMSLFATSMAIAAINVGTVRSTDRCPLSACTAYVPAPSGDPFGGLVSKAHVEAVAATLWSRNI